MLLSTYRTQQTERSPAIGSTVVIFNNINITVIMVYLNTLGGIPLRILYNLRKLKG